MFFKRQDKGIVNLNNVFCIDIENCYVTDGEADRVIECLLYRGEKWQCETYLH